MAKVSSYYYVENMESHHDVIDIKSGLSKLPGISSIYVNIQKCKIGVDYENTSVGEAGILNRMYDLGYPCIALKGL